MYCAENSRLDRRSHKLPSVLLETLVIPSVSAKLSFFDEVGQPFILHAGLAAWVEVATYAVKGNFLLHRAGWLCKVSLVGSSLIFCLLLDFLIIFIKPASVRFVENPRISSEDCRIVVFSWAPIVSGH